ncbi:MAG: sugar phosphate isomerase/epimerase [Pseudomonadota bacterium]
MLLGFNLLLWSTSVGDDLIPVLKELKETGYDGVEVPLFDGTPEDFAAFGQAIRNEGLRATAVTIMPDAAHDCTSTNPAVRDAAFDHLKWALDCSQAVGAEVLAGPFHQPLGLFSGEPPTADELANVAATHKRVVRYAQDLGVGLAVEPVNRFECYALTTVADAAELVRAVDSRSYGFLYDTFHANIEEKDPVGVIGPNLAAISHVHLSENDRGTPGKGHVPWEPTLKALKDGGYEGWCVIEAFGRALPALAAATRVWRDLSPRREEVYRFGHDFLRETWASQ